MQAEMTKTKEVLPQVDSSQLKDLKVSSEHHLRACEQSTGSDDAHIGCDVPACLFVASTRI